MTKLQIGHIKIDSPVILAPMSGVTDLPFRSLVKRHGVGLVVSEMIASRAMIYNSKKTIRMITNSNEEQPMAIQLAGCDPQVMAEAAKLNEDQGASLIDINMGCPVKKVTNGDAGSALMRDECLAGNILSAVVEAVKIPVTMKMRMGWDEKSLNAPKIAKIAEECGIQSLAVHGRTRCQFYKGRADWKFIKNVVRAVSIPVFGNGDVNTVDDAQKLLQVSGAVGVLIGRGTYGKPWFPDQVRQFLEIGQRIEDPPIYIQKKIVLEHFQTMLEHYGSHPGLRIARKHLGWYSKGIPGSSEYRSEINQLDCFKKVIARIKTFYEEAIEKTKLQ